MSSDPQNESLPQSNDLAPLIERHAKVEGITVAEFPGLILGRANRSTPRFPLVYQPSICVVAQGKKRVYPSGDNSIEYDPLHCLVVTLPMPLEAEITVTSDGRPYLGLALAIDVTAVGKLLLDIAETTPHPDEQPPQTIFALPLNNRLTDALVRLMRSMDDPLDRQVLGPNVTREVLYYLLKNKQSASSLRALALRDSNSERVARTIRYMQENYDQALDVPKIARQAGLSESTLHHTFKRLVGQSPIQYLKKTRLHQARLMMVSSGLGAGEASFRVGYSSASQFSREFKRLFGVPPSRAAETM